MKLIFLVYYISGRIITVSDRVGQSGTVSKRGMDWRTRHPIHRDLVNSRSHPKLFWIENHVRDGTCGGGCWHAFILSMWALKSLDLTHKISVQRWNWDVSFCGWIPTLSSISAFWVGDVAGWRNVCSQNPMDFNCLKVDPPPPSLARLLHLPWI